MSARILPFFTRPSRGAAEREFLPAAFEIVETPASPTLRMTAGLIGVFFVTAVLWSYLSHVDIVATAPGKVIARERTKGIQPPDAGVVRAIHVADGDKVVPGQVLPVPRVQVTGRCCGVGPTDPRIHERSVTSSTTACIRRTAKRAEGGILSDARRTCSTTFPRADDCQIIQIH